VKYRSPIPITLDCKKDKWETKKKAQLEAQYRKEMESLRRSVRLTSLLKQALRSKPEEAKFKLSLNLCSQIHRI
jgi:hypothetical protein